MRNPFPKIGKIIKYEFKHSARILLPLYGVLLILGLITGLSVNLDYNKVLESGNGNFVFNLSTQDHEAYRSLITFFLILTLIALTTAVLVVTIVTLVRRFKQSMLGEEAYLNLSLPATMGEQLWGRFIMDFGWMIMSLVVIILSFMLGMIKLDIPNMLREFANKIPEMNEALNEYNLSLGKIIALELISSLFFMIWIITLIFVANAISHLFKNYKGILKFVIVIALLWLNFKIVGLFSFRDMGGPGHSGMNYFVRNILVSDGIYFLFSAVYFAVTQFVFTKKLNLE